MCAKCSTKNYSNPQAFLKFMRQYQREHKHINPFEALVCSAKAWGKLTPKQKRNFATDKNRLKPTKFNLKAMQQSACQRRKLTTVKRRKKSCRKKPICKSQAKSMCRANLKCKSNRKPKKSCRKSKSKLQKRFSKPKPMQKCVKKAGEQYIIYLNDVPSNSQSPNRCIIWRSCKAFSNFMNEYRAKCSDPDASDVMQNGARAWQMLTNLQQSKYHHPVI